MCHAQEIANPLISKPIHFEHIPDPEIAIFKRLYENWDELYKEPFLKSFAKADYDWNSYVTIINKYRTFFEDSITNNQIFEIINQKQALIFTKCKTKKDTNQHFYEWLYLIDCAKNKKFSSTLKKLITDTTKLERSYRRAVNIMEHYSIFRDSTFIFINGRRASYFEPEKIGEYCLARIMEYQGRSFESKMGKIVVRENGEIPYVNSNKDKFFVIKIKNWMKRNNFTTKKTRNKEKKRCYKDWMVTVNFIKDHRDEAFNILVQKELNKQ
jgi:ribosomal protein L24E